MTTKRTAKAEAPKTEKHCYCPDDCSCRRAVWNPYVIALCGCQLH